MVLVHFLRALPRAKLPQAHEGKEVHLVIKGEVYAEQGEDFGMFQAGIPLAGMPVCHIWS